jgi:mono/diheme cytochrome c family protein
MKQAKWGRLLLATALMATTGAAMAADKVDFGKREYDSKCAVCHGRMGKGDGPYRALLSVPPTDLTVLARRNNGVFPFDAVVRSVDGRTELKSHGSEEMPIWGRDYSLAAGERYFDLPYYDTDAYVRARILALAEYVNRLQIK